jgi:predicted GH43/DUF377 family glycosyl hydrolase
MCVKLELFQHPLRLSADPTRVVVRPFNLAWQASGAEPSRIDRLLGNILSLDRRTVRAELALVYQDFGNRHWQMRQVFIKRFDDVAAQLDLDVVTIRDERRELIGAYLCHEYSYASAAVMNPSITLHPDQSGMQAGSSRIIMTLRAVGEGHISSVAFREGIVSEDRGFELMPMPPVATAATVATGEGLKDEGPVTVHRDENSSISGTVLFPVTDAQRNGLEDLRITRFHNDKGDREWLGTYTAYSGSGIQSELLRTKDFKSFDLIPMRGAASRNKGMALFPRCFDGEYVMIGRQDGENLFALRSADVTEWNSGEQILAAKFPWEFVQIGNCGPPVELDEGWLLLTHGVGAMRKYAVGAVLLDKKNPGKVLGRTTQPILSAADQDREGYVPNVVYTCGAMRVGDYIFMPYGVADSSIAFVFISIKSLLSQIS